jgi:hypothetical protein
MVGAVPREVDALPADLERAAIPERLLVRRPGGVVVPEQQPSRFLVPDPRDALVEERGGSDVVGVMVRVDEVVDLVADAVGGGDLVDRPLDVVADGGRCVEHDDAVRRGQERALVGAVRNPVEVPFDAADVIALLVERRAERRLRDGRVVRKGGRVGGTHAGTSDDASASRAWSTSRS